MLLQYLEAEIFICNCTQVKEFLFLFCFLIQQILLRKYLIIAPNSAIRTRSGRDFSVVCP